MSGKLNKEEQIKVVIRIKPTQQQTNHSKSVYISDQQQRTLVVQTPNKKEYFVFDSIADQSCTQSELYEQIGKDALTSSTQGYNCCIFAYGQTGAGKTHSILGKTQEIANNIYSQSRGILPRLLGDIFSWCQAEADQWSIKCSYMEIYNEQIYDLLNTDQKLSQIREDIKKGVYVDGLSEQKALNYEQAMGILLKGVKNRKIFATSMNSQSSRSHTIFTLNLQTEIKQADTVKTRKSKINIVDLAGSQRAKQTKVEGDRLKQGCNINKSLHVLGNVINALVQSSKKKKHIPFRDSKLTYYLKDSLCGNSITKLLANIHPNKSYLGDTLSTLMFAKRAKILKMKVQVNQNVGQNFQQLRKQIRKLREQLKEARYIKNQVKIQRNPTQRSVDDQLYQSWQKIVDTSGFDYSKNQNALKVLEQNELNYKALIQIYEQHMKVCSVTPNNKRRVNNMHHEWKVLERKNQTYKNLLKNMPAFTKIFKQNVVMKQQLQQKSKKQRQSPIKPISVQEINQQNCHKQAQKIPKCIMLNIKQQYESTLKQIQEKFTKYIDKLQAQYNQLQNQNNFKDAKIKDLCKRKQLPPEMEDLVNQNQYLKLNVMELEDDIAKLSDRETKYEIQIKQLRKQLHQHVRSSRDYHSQFNFALGKDQTVNPDQFTDKLYEIQITLQNDVKSFQQQRQQAYQYIQKLKDYAIKVTQDLQTQLQTSQNLKIENRNLKRKINSLLKIDNETQINPSINLQMNTFWTNEQSNISEQLQIFNRNDIQKRQQRQQKSYEQSELDRNRIGQLTEQITKLHKNYGNQILQLKEQLKCTQKQRKRLHQQNTGLEGIIKLLETQLQDSHSRKNRKQKQQIDHHKDDKKVSLTHAKSTKNLTKLKHQQKQPYQSPVSNRKLELLANNYSPKVNKSTLKIRQEDIGIGKSDSKHTE